MLVIAINHQKLKDRHGIESPSETPEGTNDVDPWLTHLISDLWSPKL